MKFREIHTPEEASKEIAEALALGQYTVGPAVEEVEVLMSGVSKAPYNVAVSSGTMGLKIALDAMGIGAGDRVIVPDITFIACASVIMELGAVPIFVDVNPETLVLDENSTRMALLSSIGKVKAIMGVRLGGEPLPEWIYSFNIPVLIDSAHSVDPHDRRAQATVYSFHPSKIISGAEGGCIATHDQALRIQARKLRSFGFEDGSRVATALGYKGNMSNLSAILVKHNIKALPDNCAYRAAVRDRFNKNLGLSRKGLGMYMVLAENPDAVCDKIPAIRHYPMTLSNMMAGVAQNPMAYQISKSLVSLPFHEWLSFADVDIICDTIKGT